MRHLADDLRQAWRVFRRNPGLAAAAVVALAMGIGFTTTMFGIVRGGTRGLPFEAADRIVAIVATTPASGSLGADTGAYELVRWQTTLDSFDALGAFQTGSVNLSGPGELPERAASARVTSNTFAMLGVAPELGRPFTDADGAPDAPPVVVISHSLWQSRFDGAADVAGRTLRVDGQLHTIVGVMPAGFGFPINARAWRPLGLNPAAVPGEAFDMQAFGRLAPGATPASATTELQIDMGRLADEFPDAYDARSARAFPFTELETPPDVRRALNLLVAIVSIVLLVACANVANLLLARAAARTRDTAIRTALGASRRRLVAQQLAESLLLAGAAATLGLLIASAGLRFFAAASAEILQAFWVDFRLDPIVLAFASALGLFAALAAGLAPALRASSGGAGALLQAQSGRVTGVRIGRLGRGLVVAQIALACGMLVVTATLVSAAGAMRLVPIPFPTDRLLTAQLGVLQDTLDLPDARAAMLLDLRDALSAEPAFRRAAFVSTFPGRGAGNWSFRLPDSDAPDASHLAGAVMVTPEFFEIAGATATRGRLLTWQDDRLSPRVAVVNESFAARYFADRAEPLGARIALGTLEFAVAGVVPDLLMEDVEDTNAAGFYISMLQSRPFSVRVMAETTGAPLDAVPALRRAITAVDADLPLLEVATLSDAIFADKRILDAIALLFLAFGVGTIFMATLGLHAILSFVVTQRTPEFGVRMALGATPRDIVRLVLRRGGTELLWGLALGLALALGLSQMLSSALERVPPAGPGVLLAIVIAVLAGALAALYVPARRVVRLDPLAALRES